MSNDHFNFKQVYIYQVWAARKCCHTACVYVHFYITYSLLTSFLKLTSLAIGGLKVYTIQQILTISAEYRFLQQVKRKTAFLARHEYHNPWENIVGWLVFFCSNDISVCMANQFSFLEESSIPFLKLSSRSFIYFSCVKYACGDNLSVFIVYTQMDICIIIYVAASKMEVEINIIRYARSILDSLANHIYTQHNMPFVCRKKLLCYTYTLHN